jgi:hypothetical protein
VMVEPMLAKSEAAAARCSGTAITYDIPHLQTLRNDTPVTARYRHVFGIRYGSRVTVGWGHKWWNCCPSHS